mgnify:CR=1 FL=1
MSRPSCHSCGAALVSTLAVMEQDATVAVWDIASGEELRRLKLRKDEKNPRNLNINGQMTNVPISGSGFYAHSGGPSAPSRRSSTPAPTCSSSSRCRVRWWPSRWATGAKH